MKRNEANESYTHTQRKRVAKINSSRCCKAKQKQNRKKWFVWLCVCAVVCMWTTKSTPKTGVTTVNEWTEKKVGVCIVYDNGNRNWVKLRHINTYTERKSERKRKNNRTAVKRNNTAQNIIEAATAVAAAAPTRNQIKWRERKEK